MDAVPLVELHQDHPGFNDRVYRRRRDAIAAAAISHRSPDPAPAVDYTHEELGVWRTVLGELLPMHARLACAEHLAAWPRVQFAHDRIPQLADVSRTLSRATGFSLQPVAGLVSPRAFMERLADGVFLATQYMRHHTRPLYTPEPDVIHELIGHAALLTTPRFADVNRAFGIATRRVDDTQIDALIRAYWYGLEFGLVSEGGQPKAVGAGLLSSFGELGRVEKGVKLVPFSIASVTATPFDPTIYQETLFVADSLDALLDELSSWLATF